MPENVQPSELELQILGVLWRKGPLPVRQVLAAMPDGKQRAYTSVLSVMQVMEKKGLLTHTSSGTSHVYKPAVNRTRVLGPLMRRLVRNVFGGDSTAAVQHLLRESELKQADVAELRQFLDQMTADEGAEREDQP